jgi:hypothetical protein
VTPGQFPLIVAQSGTHLARDQGFAMRDDDLLRR